MSLLVRICPESRVRMLVSCALADVAGGSVCLLVDGSCDRCSLTRKARE